jgi:4'-phosphopantetheinyl transferase
VGLTTESPRPSETLGATGIVDLHYFCWDAAPDPSPLARYEAWMTPDERERHGRYRFARDRDLFLLTRALVRSVLSLYAPVEPEAWRFVLGEHGKPRIDPSGGAPNISFNLSNAHGMVVCAVSGHGALGVDVEDVARKSETLDIADRFFSPSEVAALRALPRARQRTRFFELWTLKESYIKARGLGLAIPLDHFSFELDDVPAIRIAFEPQLADDPARWRFASLPYSAKYLIAVGVDSGGAPLTVRAASHGL